MWNAQNIRMRFCATTCASSLQRSRSEWASINRTCVLLCITTCRKIWRAITRRPDAPGAMDCPANAYCSSARAMLPSNGISLTKKPTRRRECRRAVLLEYFGETFPLQSCDSCDSCLQPRETFDGTVQAQKFLSSVYRIHARHGFGFGLGHIVDVLRGADTEAIRQRGHNELSTYGIGGELKRAEWQAIGRELLRLGLVEIAEKRARIKQGAIECDEVLFARLRALRRQLADERGVPAYIIFSDVSLREMARKYPTNSREFRRIPGVGEQKLKDFGEVFISAIKSHSTENQPAIFSKDADFTFPTREDSLK